MGRKKKQKQIVANSTPTTIEYKGDVSISILRKGKIIKAFKNHNDGKPNLFRFILDCLAGNYYEVNRPFWIVPYYTESNQDYYSIPKFIPINNNTIVSYDTNEQLYILTYKCLINASLLGSNTKINGLLFYSTNVKNKIDGFSAGTIVKDSEGELYSMKMSFGDIDQTDFEDQDLLIT